MGVRSLSGYLFRQENGVSELMSLAQAIEEFKRKYACGSSPVLIVDGSVIVYWIYEGLDWLCQGQWREYAYKVQQFVDLIRNAGIEPIFCFDGGVSSSKHEVWLERRRSDLRKVPGVFDALKAGRDPSRDKDLTLLPPSLTSETSLLLKYQCSVEVYQSTLDGDLEIALLARQLGLNKCIGILSRDTDFLIYNTAGVPLLLLDGHSPFSDPKVYRCNQEVFASNLGLGIDQLPLLACLMGNDSFPLEIVKPFHASLPRIPYGNWFTNLLSSVSNILRPYHRGYSLVELEIRVFGANTGRLSEAAGLYWKALENVPRQETGLFRDIVESKRLRLMTADKEKLEEYLPTGIEYPRFTRLPLAVFVFRPVRLRYLSTVGKPYVKEFSLHLEGIMDGSGQTLQTVPIGATVQHLHQPNVPDAFKWKTFAQLWQFPERLLEGIKMLPETLQAITMALRLVWVQWSCELEGTVLETWEMEAVVRHCYLLHLNKGVMSCELGLPLPRGVHLGLLVARIFTNLTRTVLACNFPIKLESVMPWNVFDGKVMQYYYKQMSNLERFEPLSSTEQMIMQLICP